MKKNNKKGFMKMFSAVALSLLFVAFGAGTLAGCGEPKVESIEIVSPTGEIHVGDSFALDFNVLPEKAKETAKVKWEIEDDRRLSQKDNEFEALSCGTVKVTASVAGCDATDEINLNVVPPIGYTLHKGTGYSIILPSSFEKVLNTNTWKSNSYQYFNFVVNEEELNESYFKATASMFQSTYETMFSLIGMKVTFTKPVTVGKETYLGVRRVRVESEYTATMADLNGKLYQTQVIFNNVEKNLSCCLTVTYNGKEYDDSIKEIGEFVISQFLPI